MAISSNITKGLKNISRYDPGGLEISKLVSGLHFEPDRGLVIVGASILENVLQDFIIQRLLPLSKNEIDSIFDPDKALSTFSSKIQIGYALGIYGKRIRRDLDLIRHIRNAFAHSRKPIDFENESVKLACNSFGFYKSIDDPRGINLGNPDFPWPPKTARQQFHGSVYTIIFSISWQYQGSKQVAVEPPPAHLN